MSAPAAPGPIASALRLRLGRHHLNTLIYLGVSFLGKAFSFLLLPLYTARLTRAEYGSYGLALTLYSLVPPITSLSLGSALARFYFDDKDPRRRAETMGTIAAAIIAVSCAAAAVAELTLDLWGLPMVGALTNVHWRIVIWTCASMSIAEIAYIYSRAAERAVVFAGLQIALVVITSSTTLYLMLGRGMGVTGILVGILAGHGSIALLATLFTVKRLRPRYLPGLIRSAASYSIPFIPHSIGNALMVGADRWALQLYGLTDDLGLYTLAVQLTLPIGLATSAWNEASSPRLLRAWRDGGDDAARAALPRVTLGFAVAGGGALALVILALPLMSHFIGPRFRAAFPLVPWIGLGLFVGNFFSAFINILFLRKTTKIIPVLTMSSVAVNIALNAVLVPLLGVAGAILATGLAYTFRTGLMLRFARRALRRPQPVETAV